MSRRGLTFFAAAAGLCGCGQLLGLDQDARLVGYDEVSAACGSCDDHDPCTVDVCDTMAVACRHAPAADGLAPEQVAGDCAENWCTAGTLERRAHDADLPNDGSSCTLKACHEGVASLTPLALGSPCAQNGGDRCDGAGKCVACLTDADCAAPNHCKAGSCECQPKSCGALGQSCGVVADGCGGALQCDDAAVSGSETDIDCGGPTSTCATRCGDGRACLDAGDCESGYCAAGVCRERWTATLGGLGSEAAAAVAIAPDGSVVVAGSYEGVAKLGAAQGSLPPPQQGQAIFVVKLSPAGKLSWTRSFGSGAPVAAGVAVDAAGNIALAGTLVGELQAGATIATNSPRGFVLKLDGKGDLLWADWLCSDATCSDDGGTSQLGAVAIDASDRVVVTGRYGGPFGVWSPGAASGTASLPSGDAEGDGFVLRLDTAGVPGLAIPLPGKGAQLPTALACSTNRIVVGGDFHGTLALGPAGLDSVGALDMFVAALDLAGKPVFTRRFGPDAAQSTVSEHLAALTLDAQHGVILAGALTGSVDFGGGAVMSKGADDLFVAKLDASGGHQWSHAFGDAKSQRAAGVSVDAHGRVFVVGSFDGTMPIGPKVLVSNGGYDVAAIALDNHGGPLFAAGFGDGSVQLGRAVAANGFGGAVLAGDYFGTIDFGGGKLAASGGADVFVAAFAP